MIEDPAKLNVTLEGRVTITSGKILIVDAREVKGVDLEWFYRFIPEFVHNLEDPIKCEYEDLIHERHLHWRASSNYTDELIKSIKTKSPLPERPPSFEEKEKLIKKLKKIMKKMVKEHPRSPPYFLQGNERVYGRCREDCLATFIIDLNFSEQKTCRELDDSFREDEFIITDAKEIKGHDDPVFSYKEYFNKHSIEVPNGTYVCEYVNENKKIKISLSEK